MAVPAHVKGDLPDCDFMFENGYIVPLQACLVDADFSWVEAVNDSSAAVTIERKARLGTLCEADFPTACYVSTQASESMEETQSVEPRQAVYSRDKQETTLPNGVTIYGSPAVAADFAEVISKYQVWGERTGFVDIPEDQWMTIPLIDGWESKLPRTKVYPVGPRGRQVIDETFDKLRQDGKLSPVTNHCPFAWFPSLLALLLSSRSDAGFAKCLNQLVYWRNSTQDDVRNRIEPALGYFA